MPELSWADQWLGKPVGFTGTHHGMTKSQLLVLWHFITIMDPSEAHHGDCIGADTQFHQVVKFHNFHQHQDAIKLIGHPPSDGSRRGFSTFDESFEPKEYKVRNRDIVNCSKVMLATPRLMREEQRSGTWATIRFAARTGCPTLIIWPNGEATWHLTPEVRGAINHQLERWMQLHEAKQEHS